MLKYKIIAVDLDGTLIQSGKSYPCIERVNYEAVNVLNQYRKHGGKVIIWTLRTDSHLDIALHALKQSGLQWDAVNENLQESIDDWDNKYPNMSISPKVCCDLFIDDRNDGTHEFPRNGQAIKRTILQEEGNEFEQLVSQAMKNNP